MKKILTLSVTLLCVFNLFAQKEQLLTDCTQPTQRYDVQTNSLTAAILNGGDLFWDLTSSKFGLKPQFGQPFIGTIFAGGLWMGGKNTANVLKVATSTYRMNNNSDYWAGPLQNGLTEYAICKKWDKLWMVVSKDIDIHVSQVRQGVITDTIASVFGWPGKNNPYFFRFNGFELPPNQNFAPFFDKNGDGNYTPQYGDYPLPENTVNNAVPNILVWCIFNDAGGVHTNSLRSNPVFAEIHQTVWAYNTSNLIDSCIFTSHKIINKGAAAIDSFYIGQWVDFDLGCYSDDFIGCLPAQNTFYVYNENAIDPINCNGGIRGFGANPPVQSVTFLNKPLSKFMTYYNSAIGNPPVYATQPIGASEYYNYLSGKWPDGTKLTRGNWGHNPPSNDTTNYAFTGLPLDTSGWSMYQMNRRSLLGDFDAQALGSTYIGRFNPLDTARLDIVYSLHQGLNGNNIDNVYKMVDNLPKITNVYQQRFIPLAHTVSVNEFEKNKSINIYPNPTSGQIWIQSKDALIESVEMYNGLGQVLLLYSNIKNDLFEMNTHSIPDGLYYLKIKTENKTKIERVVVQH